MGSPASSSILIVEDDPLARLLLRDHVERLRYRAVEAVGAWEGLLALEADRSVSLVLTDVRLPTPEIGLEFIRLVRRRWPALPIVAVTANPAALDDLREPERPTLIIGKPFWARDIKEALQLVKGPDGDLTRGHSALLEAAPAAIHPALTTRESEVYGLLLAGRTNKEIADDLVISQKTVEFRLRRVFRKLGVRSRVQAILTANPPGTGPPPKD